MSTAKATGTRYLYRQGRKYWVRIVIPEDVREAFEGRREYWENLQATDLRAAQTRIHRYASDFFAKVEEARGRKGSVAEDALFWRKQIEDAKAHEPEDRDHPGPGEVIDLAIKTAAEKYVSGGYKAVSREAELFHDGSTGDALLALGGLPAKAFVDIALGGQKPLAPFVSPWSAVRETEVEPKTAAMDKTAVLRFVSAFPLASGVSKAAVAEWVERRKADVSAQTIQREVTGIRSFWGYLQAREEVSADLAPFTGLRFKDRQKDRASARRVAFKAAEVSALYAAALKAEDQPLADLIALAAYTGARREELCGLKVGNVSWEGGGWLTIKGAKTDAGNREVPIHQAVLPLVKRLVGKRSAGFVLEGLDEDQWGRRGDALGKRFGRLKASQGHGPEKTFHSIRHAFVQLMRATGAPEDLVADLVGHRVATMTGGRYGSAEARRKLLPGTLQKLKYARPLN